MPPGTPVELDALRGAPAAAVLPDFGGKLAALEIERVLEATALGDKIGQSRGCRRSSSVRLTTMAGVLRRLWLPRRLDQQARTRHRISTHFGLDRLEVCHEPVRRYCGGASP